MATLDEQLLAYLASNPQAIQQGLQSSANGGFNQGGWNFNPVQIAIPGKTSYGESDSGPQLAQQYEFLERSGLLGSAGAQIDPRTGQVSIGGQTMTPDEFQKRYVVASQEMRGGNGQGATDWQDRIYDTQTGQIVGSDAYKTSGFNFLKDLALPALGIWGGAAALGSLLGGGAAAAGGGAASGAAGGAAASGGLAPLTGIGSAAEIASLPTLASSGVGAAAWNPALAAINALPAGATVGSAAAGLAPTLGGAGTGIGTLGPGGTSFTPLPAEAMAPIAGSPSLPAIPAIGGSLPSIGAGGGLLGSIGSAAGGLASAVGGAGNLAAAVGGLLGASQGGKNTTQTTESKIDPRMAQYLYGSGYGDPNSYLGAAQQWFTQNRGGMNDLMQQGLDMQKATLTDPGLSAGYGQMRNIGSGLLGGPVAANPFTSGQASLQQQQMPQQSMSQIPMTVEQMIARGRGLLG